MNNMNNNNNNNNIDNNIINNMIMIINHSNDTPFVIMYYNNANAHNIINIFNIRNHVCMNLLLFCFFLIFGGKAEQHGFPSSDVCISLIFYNVGITFCT